MPKGGKRANAGVKPRAGETSHNHSIKFTDTEWEELRTLSTSEKSISDYVRKKALNK